MKAFYVFMAHTYKGKRKMRYVDVVLAKNDKDAKKQAINEFKKAVVVKEVGNLKEAIKNVD